MTPTTIASKLPDIGVSIFAVMTKLANEHKAINLSQGFPDFDCDPALVEAVAAAMRAGHNQYAPMPGVLALREAIAAKVEQCYGAALRPGDRSGGDVRRDRWSLCDADGVRAARRRGRALRALLRLVRAGDSIEWRHAGVRQPALSGLRVDWDEVRRAITPRTRAILVNTPHNPTGMTWSADDMRRLTALVDGTDIIVIGDEVYEHIIFDGARHESLLRYPDLRSRAVVISSFGKTFHTTGWKVGYCVAPQPLMTEVIRIHQFMTFTVHSASQIAFAEFVRKDPTARDLPAFYQAKRDLFLAADRRITLQAAGVRRHLLPVARLLGHHARQRQGRRASHPQGARRRVHCRVGVPLQGHRRSRAAILFREEGRNADRGRRAAAPRVDCRRRTSADTSTRSPPGMVA